MTAAIFLQATLSPIPPWMQIFSFAVSLLIAIVTLYRLLNPTSLDTVVTKDLFLRIIDDGDGIFLNVLFLARNGNVLIEKADVQLTKLGSVQKTFPLEVVRVGEKVRSVNVLAEHNFYSSSPIEFVPSSKPKRLVYLCTNTEYTAGFAGEHEKFVSWASSYAETNPFQMLQRLSGTQAQDEAIKIDNVINKRVDDFIREAMDILQIEDGWYQLTVTVSYSGTGLIKRKKNAITSIKFRLPGGLRTQIRNELHRRYRAWVYQKVGGKEVISYEDYLPVEFQEVI